MDIDMMKRDFSGEMLGHHHHPCDPEKDDVKAGHQHAGAAVVAATQHGVEARHAAADALVGDPGIDAAEHAGYGQAAVFFHFKTKAGLLQACLDSALEQAKAQGGVVAGGDYRVWFALGLFVLFVVGVYFRTGKK